MRGTDCKSSDPHPATPSAREAFLLRGAAELPQAPWRLRAGPVEMDFDPATAFLRRLRVGRVELVRAIYGAVRDRNWGTVAPQISIRRSQISEDAFTVEFEADCRAGAIHLRWLGKITGQGDGTVVFDFDGEARSTFLRNRIGLCVLHPIDECAGQPCTVEHTDGRVTHGQFPRLITPHQQFKEIRAITHEAAPSLRVEVRLTGETFEMEDQRNWTDTSFKTYGTPLELPFPVEITAGTRVRQAVTVRVTSADKCALHRQHEIVQGFTPRSRSKAVRLAADFSGARPLPPIGLGMAGHGQPLTAHETERLRALRLAHLRVDLRLDEAAWRERLAQAVEESSAIGVALEMVLFLTDEAEHQLDALIAACRAASARVARWLVFHAGEKSTSRHWIELARRKLRAFSTAVPIAAGTDANFAELNRERPPAGLGVLPCFSLNPQVHAFDHETLVENLAAQAHAVVSAHAFSGQPVAVSPITLRPRFNAVATAADAQPAADELPLAVDPRQMSLFGAAWTLGSLSMLAPLAEVHSLTFYETTGWRGVMEREAGSPLPEKFPSRPGEVFPVFHVFAALGGFKKVFPLRSSQSLAVLGLGLLDADDRKRLLIANLSGEQQEVEIEPFSGAARLRVLDETNLDGVACKPSIGRLCTGAARLRRWALAIVDFSC